MFRRLITIPETKYWLSSINSFEELLNNIIPKTIDISTKEYYLRKNIAYNLQYIEYLKTNIENGPFSKEVGIIYSLNIKIYLIISSSIIETLLYYLLFKNGQLNSDEIEGIKYKKIIGKCKSNHLLGNIRAEDGEDIYNKLDNIRELRNKIHLYIGNTNNDHDYNSFSDTTYIEARKTLIYIFKVICIGINTRFNQDDEFLKIFNSDS